MSLESHRSFVYRGVTFCAGPFACPSTTTMISYSLPGRQPQLSDPTTPRTQRLTAITRARFGLFRFRSPLLTESRLLSLPVGTEMFHFPTFPPHALCVQAWVTGHDSSRVSPFGYPRITAWLPAPRGLSQAPTSFIGSWCQGIHRAPLLTWPQRCLFRVHCAVLKLRAVAGSFAVAHADAAELHGVVRRGGSRGEGGSWPTPSGLNSVPRVTTEQTYAVPCRECGRTRQGCSSWRPTGQCSTHEHRPRDVRPRRGSGPGR